MSDRDEIDSFRATLERDRRMGRWFDLVVLFIPLIALLWFSLFIDTQVPLLGFQHNDLPALQYALLLALVPLYTGRLLLAAHWRTFRMQPAVSIAWFVLLFAALVAIFAHEYLLLQRDSPHSFTEHMTEFDAVYLAVTTFTTLGSGSLNAIGEQARAVVIFETLTALVVIGVGLASLVSAVRRG
jgi:hypothetical protein